MSRVQELQRTIQELTLDEFAEIAHYVHNLEQEYWDRRLDSDAATGKLDFLFEEASKDQQAGLLRTWPPSA